MSANLRASLPSTTLITYHFILGAIVNTIMWKKRYSRKDKLRHSFSDEHVAGWLAGLSWFTCVTTFVVSHLIDHRVAAAAHRPPNPQIVGCHRSTPLRQTTNPLGRFKFILLALSESHRSNESSSAVRGISHDGMEKK